MDLLAWSDSTGPLLYIYSCAESGREEVSKLEPLLHMNIHMNRSIYSPSLTYPVHRIR